MTPNSTSERYALVEGDPGERVESFASAVGAGLGRRPRSLPCRFLYDEIGSGLFEEICELPEYYLTRAEHEILAANSDAIAAALPQRIALAELGSGSSSKTRLLIEALLRRQTHLRYIPVDISRSMLDESARDLLDDYESLEIHAIASEYRDGLHHVGKESHYPKLIGWLGSNIGNFTREQARHFVRGIRDAMSERDRVLLGVDLRKDPAVLHAAYDDASGVTARFNLNLLARINRELGGHFDLERFRHRAMVHETEGRVELGVVSLDDCEVAVDALDCAYRFAAGEFIHTEDSYKYSLDEIDALAADTGLRVEARWLDAASRFSLNLLAAT